MQLNVEILLRFSIKVSKPGPSQQQQILKNKWGSSFLFRYLFNWDLNQFHYFLVRPLYYRWLFSTRFGLNWPTAFIVEILKV
jgi:hypothetical protein